MKTLSLDVMKTLSLVVVGLLSLIPLASLSADIPASGDVVRIGDLEYVIVSRADYERLSQGVAALQSRWAVAHSNEHGRVAFHGARRHTTITNGYIEVEYADGYKHREGTRSNAVPRTNRAPRAVASPSPSAPITRKENLPAALARLREARKQKRTVTVEMGASK